MKIVLLTIWHVKNYGAELQTYATVKKLKELGYVVEVIDFRLFNEVDTQLWSKRLSKFLQSFLPVNRKFNSFWKKYIPSTKCYHSLEDLRAFPPEADLYLVGSDQVWNPRITLDKAPVYFLPFGQNSVLKASFASSIGTAKWTGDESLTHLAINQLKSFKAISCREQTGVEIVKNVFGLDAKLVADPTLLFTNYKELTGIVHPKKELVFYPLSENNEMELFCMNLAKVLNLSYKNANNQQKTIRSIVWNRPSVETWIKMIAGASIVVTPSFHGLSMSLLHHRQFIILAINQNGRSSRITDLLSYIGLIDRYFTSYEEVLNSKIWEQEIDYIKVDNKLSILREQSIEYLRQLSV